MKLLIFYLIVSVIIAFVQAESEELEDIFYNGVPPLDPASVKASSSKPVWKTIWLRQDNFDPLNGNKWLMRYIENADFYQPGGPIFILVGGEWTLTENWLQGGLVYDLAKQTNATLYYTEHRYYGKSYPTTDTSTENLHKYLNVDQALADIANFIIQIKKSDIELAYSKVVVFGGSYAGTLATWMRLKYPHLVHAAASFSAPIVAVNNFHQYNEKVNNVLPSQCKDVIHEGSNFLLELIKNGSSAQITEDFKLCKSINLDNIDEVHYLFYKINGIISKEVQYGNNKNQNIYRMCKSLMNPTDLSPYKRFANFVKTYSLQCIQNFQKYLEWHTNTSLNSLVTRPWQFQKCTEFGFMTTSDHKNALFGNSIPLSFRETVCKGLFSSQFTLNVTDAGVTLTNEKFGGLRPALTRVISTYGTNDPWSTLGLKRSLNPDAPVYYINKGAHCEEMTSLSYFDSKDMVVTKHAIYTYIKKWLQLPSF